MAEDKVTITGEALISQIQKSWTQLIDDIKHLIGPDKQSTFERLLTLLGKHIHDAEKRNDLLLYLRAVFSGNMNRARADVVLSEFFILFFNRAMESYDELSPMVYPAIQAASNTQVVKFPTREILDAIYRKEI